MKKSRVKALLFDMDGLLIDTEGLYLAVYEEMLRIAGGRCDKELLESFVGMSTENVCAKILEASPQCSLSAEKLAEMEEDIYLRKGEALSLPPALGLKEIFELARAEGLKCGLVSNSSAKKIAATMGRLWLSAFGSEGWRSSFAAVCDVGRAANCKPSPELYLLAVSELGLAPPECAAFEDSSAGIESAAAAGCKTIAVPSVHIGAESFKGLRFDFKFQSLLEACEKRGLWLG